MSPFNILAMLFPISMTHEREAQQKQQSPKGHAGAWNRNGSQAQLYHSHIIRAIFSKPQAYECPALSGL